MQLVDFATRRRVTVIMCTVALLLFGMVSLSRLKVNLLPDLSYPDHHHSYELNGAAPLEVEKPHQRGPLRKRPASSATSARSGRCHGPGNPT